MAFSRTSIRVTCPDDFRDIHHCDPIVHLLSFNGITQHFRTAGAGDSHDFSARIESLPDAHPAGTILSRSYDISEKVSATAAAAKGIDMISAYLRQFKTRDAPQYLAGRGIDQIMRAQIAGIMVGNP